MNSFEIWSQSRLGQTRVGGNSSWDWKSSPLVSRVGSTEVLDFLLSMLPLLKDSRYLFITDLPSFDIDLTGEVFFPF